MDDFETPTFTTVDGTRVIVTASPAGLLVRARSATGADSSAGIPAEVALTLLDDATALGALLRGE